MKLLLSLWDKKFDKKCGDSYMMAGGKYVLLEGLLGLGKNSTRKTIGKSIGFGIFTEYSLHLI